MGTGEILEIFGITPGLIISIIIIIAILFVILEFNRFIQLRNKIKQSKSSIEVYLNQRFDLIPNLVECVKGYANYEEKVFSEIAQLRNEYDSQKEKDLKTGAKINSEFNDLLALAEDNPNLKASEQFLNLQRNLTKMESQLQAARRVYNGDVTLYNTTINTFPNNIFAQIFKFKEAELFEIDEYKKENVKMDL